MFERAQQGEDQQKEQQVALEYFVRCKLDLTNEIYTLLTIMCQDQEYIQLEAYNNLHLVIEHFKRIDSCRKYVACLITNNESIAHSLENDFNYERIMSFLPKENTYKIDLVVVDNTNEFVHDFDRMKKDLHFSKSRTTNGKKRVINLLVYCGILLIKSDFNTRIHIMIFLNSICVVQGQPNKIIQDLIYKLF